MKFTVLGSTGFVGSRMVSYLREQGHDVATPPRDTQTLSGRPAGHVIYAIGLTGNFRTRPQATVEAHVNVLQRLITDADYESWLYLSSTRVYGGLGRNDRASEDIALPVKPSADSLYDLSKLLGESICMSINNQAVRVARLSNVYGAGQSPDTFLGSVVTELKQTRKVTFGESPESSKDYICVDDAVRILASIVINGKERLYNVASGKPVTHRQLADIISGQGYSVEFATAGLTRTFPLIDTSRLYREFNITPASLLDDFPRLLSQKD